MINYIEKGIWMHKAIGNAGHWLRQVNNVWESDDDPVVQVIIDDFDPLPFSQNDAKARIKVSASAKMSTIYSFISPTSEEALGLYDYTVDIYQLIVPAAREPITGRLLEFKTVYDTAKVGLADVNAETDWTLCDAVAQVTIDAIEAL